MFTSAVTSGYCFVERIRSRVKLGFKSLALFVCFMAIPLSGLGFSNLIGTVYPIFGYAGMVIVMGVLVNGIIKRPSQLNGSKKQKTG